MSNFVNNTPYLRSSREFPENIKDLAFQSNKAYLEVANAINQRTIGIYSVNKPSINGKEYFFTSQKQQGLMKMYSFTNTLNIDLGFKLNSLSKIIHMYGTYTDGTSYFGLISASNIAIAGQISFFVTVNGASTTSDIIQFVIGAGAPILTNGTIIIEWASKSSKFLE